MKSVLIICTGNSCRSQMAEGWLRSFSADIEVHSAGTFPASRVSSKAVAVMKESGIDISGQSPKSVDQFLARAFDYVVTVCDDARETCPVFIGKVGKRIHLGFEDPSNATGSESEILDSFRKTRDEVRSGFRDFYDRELKGSRG